MRFGKKQETGSKDPLISEIRALDPFSMEEAEKLFYAREIPFLKREVTPALELVEEAVLAIGEKRGKTKRLLSFGALLAVSILYLVDFIKDPSYTVALVLAVFAGALGIYFWRQPVRDAKKTAPLYCENVPMFSLCLFEKGIIFTDGAGNPDVAGKNELFWVESEHLFACLVRERGLVYFEKSSLDEDELTQIRDTVWAG